MPLDSTWIRSSFGPAARCGASQVSQPNPTRSLIPIRIRPEALSNEGRRRRRSINKRTFDGKGGERHLDAITVLRREGEGPARGIT